MTYSSRRSWLLAPPLGENWFTDALSHHPDVLVVDLVELVSDGGKPQARQLAREALREGVNGTSIYAQVDKWLLTSDLEAVVWPGLEGIIIPRLESPQEVNACEYELTRLEQERELAPNSLQIVASLDTAQGNHRAMEIATASKRLWGITLSRADLEMDLRPEPSGEIHLVPYLMERLIIIARAARLIPLGAWWRPPARGLLASSDETYQAAVRGKALGFKGSLCLRGDQVEALNKGYG